MAEKTGYQCKLYYQTDGLAGSAGFVEATLARDVSTSLARNASDASSRRSTWKGYLPGQIDAEVTGQLVFDNADAGVSALESAFTGGTTIGVEVLDGAAGHGLILDAILTSWNRSEPLDETVTVDFTLRPDAKSATAPSLGTGSGGA
jgi:hypothetical protein